MIRFIRGTLTAGALAAASLFAGEARASYQDFIFTATVAAATPPDTPTVFASTAAVTNPATPTGNPPDVTTFSAVGSGGAVATPTSIIFGSVSDTGLAGSTSADVNINYDFRLSFTVDPVGSSNPPNNQQVFTVDITGNLSGTISRNSTGSYSYGVFNTYDQSRYTVVVPGVAIYLIRPNGFTPPSSVPGSFSAFVTATPIPEPTTFALMGVGGSILLAPYLRRKARQETA